MDVEALRRGAEAPVLAARNDLGGVAADLSDAFAEDVMFDWFLRPDRLRDAARLAFFDLVIRRMVFGTGRIYRPPVGGAAAVWLPFAALRPTPLITEMRAMPTLLFATGLARFGRLAAMREAMDRAHPMDRPHAYLMFLGVARAAQGRGVGSRLLTAGVRRCDDAGLPVYLETQTERNLGFYRRHGFEILSEARPRRGAPRLWSLWREAQKAGGG
jgi:ribosomal protein S18 acetylase RimI-like enzyme